MRSWKESEAGKTEIENLVYLSNLIGEDPALVQPGGGNTSVKVAEPDIFGTSVPALVVKGSGTDLRTITAEVFTHLYLDQLALIHNRDDMPDEEMMALMRASMLFPDRDPVPSVETPLHSLLPFRFVAHTHDVATLSLSDTPEAERNVRKVFGQEVLFLEYVRPGFPLAKRLAERYADGFPKGARAMVMEKHGLAVWGETGRECYDNLRSVIRKAEEFVAKRGRVESVFGEPQAPALEEDVRRGLAAALLPLVRGQITRHGWDAVLHFEDSEGALGVIAGERFADLALRGVMTPEHIMRAGRRPLVLSLDLARYRHTEEHPAPAEVSPGDRAPEHLAEQVRDAFRRFRDEYEDYCRANGRTDPIPDYLKVVAIPGLGIVFAGKDRRNAMIAADCYAATLEAIAGAEAVERFRFIPDHEVFEMEYWPLERRKIEQASRRELEGKVAVVIGAASGTGRATALRFAEEGAHVACVDLDLGGARTLADEINARAPERAIALAANAADPDAIAAAFRDAVLHFGGVDVLFYSPGVVPELHSVAAMPEAEVEREMNVHFRGAVAATREAARIMLQQGSGGRLIYNASKAAFAPGEGAAAYGASKAALVHYVRNAANELSRHGITANYINADAVDTPLFQALVRQRAADKGEPEEQTLQRYADRSVFRTATVPPEAVADAALFLASERARWTTGCAITVGGGHEGFPR